MEQAKYPHFTEVAQSLGYRNVHVYFSKRLKTSWKLRCYFTGKKEVTLPHTLEHAPIRVKESILHWTHLKRPHFKKNRAQYYKEKKLLESVVWDYLKECGTTVSGRSISEKRIKNLKTVGQKFDLLQIFNEINSDYFDNDLVSYIRWGQKKTKTSYQTWYTNEANKKVSMITIASLYNHPDVPEYALRSVVFHEMLHIAVPPYTKNGRRVVHGKEFKEAQKRNPDLLKWNKWEREGLQKILRSRKY